MFLPHLFRLGIAHSIIAHIIIIWYIIMLTNNSLRKLLEKKRESLFWGTMNFTSEYGTMNDELMVFHFKRCDLSFENLD